MKKRTWRTTVRQLFSHKGRMYELFYWMSVGTDWMIRKRSLEPIKDWIDQKEYDYWSKWVSK